MRVCIEKSTGKLIDSQSGGETHLNPKIDDKEYALINLETLRQNAINAGYKEADIEVKYITDGEFQVITDAIPKPESTEEQFNETKIQAKIRELVIKSLIADGELPKDYK